MTLVSTFAIWKLGDGYLVNIDKVDGNKMRKLNIFTFFHHSQDHLHAPSAYLNPLRISPSTVDG